MEIFSTLPVTGRFPSQRPVTQSSDVFFDVRLNKRVSKESISYWFESHGAHYNVTVMQCNNVNGYGFRLISDPNSYP